MTTLPSWSTETSPMPTLPTHTPSPTRSPQWRLAKTSWALSKSASSLARAPTLRRRGTQRFKLQISADAEAQPHRILDVVRLFRHVSERIAGLLPVLLHVLLLLSATVLLLIVARTADSGTPGYAFLATIRRVSAGIGAALALSALLVNLLLDDAAAHHHHHLDHHTASQIHDHHPGPKAILGRLPQKRVDISCCALVGSVVALREYETVRGVYPDAAHALGIPSALDIPHPRDGLCLLNHSHHVVVCVYLCMCLLLLRTERRG